jgi:two-component sensor histidine kinase
MSARGRRLHGMPADDETYTIESWIQRVHPDDRPAVQAALYKALAGQAVYDVEYRVVLPDGQIRWIGARGRVYPGPSGEPRRVAGISYDITQRKQAEQRLRLLAREVDHRAKNLLSVIQSMVRMTRARTIEEFIDAVEGRIAALGRAHTLLADSRWIGADLHRLVKEELAPHRGRNDGRVHVDGPTVMLTPQAAQSVSMALHELATNAAKYGALSVPDGHVSLSWSWTEDGRLAVRWTETGGPRVRPPTQFGFGTRVINGTIKRQLGGDVQFDWAAEGLRCFFLLPAAALREIASQELK